MKRRKFIQATTIAIGALAVPIAVLAKSAPERTGKELLMKQSTSTLAELLKEPHSEAFERAYQAGRRVAWPFRNELMLR